MIKKIIKKLYASTDSIDNISTSSSKSDESSYAIQIESSSEYDSDSDSIEIISGDTSSKIVYRQYHDLNKYNIKSSVIIDFSKLKEISDEYLFISDIYDTTQYELFREINTYLYMKIPHNIGCRVPEIYACSDYTKSLQIEDLGSTDLLKYGFKFTIYRDIIRWLAYLNKLYTGKNIQYFIKYRKYEMLAISHELSDFVKYCGDDYMYLVENVLEKANYLPKSICHRDFQPRNIMICNGQPRIIDVQDMCIGPLTYDLGSLLYDPFVVISKSDIDVLTTLYSFLTNMNTKKIQKLTKLCGRIRLMKMAGRHAKIYQKTKNENNKIRSDKAIERLLSI